MAIEFQNTDISDASLGNAYGRGNPYKIASYSSGWTVTGIDITGTIVSAVSQAATNTGTWENQAIEWPIMAALAIGATGFTPVKPNDADMANSQWLWLENAFKRSVSPYVANGSTAIGINSYLPYELHWRGQMRLTEATDIYFYLWNQYPEAPEFYWQGNSTVWVS
jgi:hypothetical protein